MRILDCLSIVCLHYVVSIIDRPELTADSSRLTTNNATVQFYASRDGGIETRFEDGGERVHNLSGLPQRVLIFGLIKEQHPFPASLGEQAPPLVLAAADRRREMRYRENVRLPGPSEGAKQEKPVDNGLRYRHTGGRGS